MDNHTPISIYTHILYMYHYTRIVRTCTATHVSYMYYYTAIALSCNVVFCLGNLFDYF